MTLSMHQASVPVLTRALSNLRHLLVLGKLDFMGKPA